MTLSLRLTVATVLSLTLQIREGGAQTLLGLRNPGDGGRQLTTIDTATGAVVALGASISPPLSTSSNTAVDATNNLLFVAGTPSGDTDARIYSISLASGTVATNPTMVGTGAATIFGLEYDAGEGAIYGIRNPGSGARQLVSINRTTGAVVGLGAGTGVSTSSSAGVNALDASGNRFFFVGMFAMDTDSRLFVFDTTDGTFTSVVMTGTSANPIAGLEYDAAEGVLYAVRNPGGGARQLATVNIGTGVVTGLGAGTGVSTSGSGGVTTLDASGNRFFFVGTPDPDPDPRIYTFDTTDGSIDANPTLAGGPLFFAGIDYEPTPLPVELLSAEVQ